MIVYGTLVEGFWEMTKAALLEPLADRYASSARTCSDELDLYSTMTFQLLKKCRTTLAHGRFGSEFE